MAITIKEIQVKTSIEKSLQPASGNTAELRQKIRQIISEEIKNAQRNKTKTKKER